MSNVISNVIMNEVKPVELKPAVCVYNLTHPCDGDTKEYHAVDKTTGETLRDVSYCREAASRSFYILTLVEPDASEEKPVELVCEDEDYHECSGGVEKYSIIGKSGIYFGIEPLCKNSVKEYFNMEGEPLNYGSFNKGNGRLYTYNKDGDLRKCGIVENGLKVGYWLSYTNAGLMDSTLYLKGIAEGKSRVSRLYFY